MSARPEETTGRNVPENTRLETYLKHTAAEFTFPPTPDLAGAEHRRMVGHSQAGKPSRKLRLVYVLAILLVALAAGITVTPVGARVLEWIRIGSVRIFLGEPTTTPLPTGTVPAAAQAATPTPLQSALDLAGETTLAQAREKAGFSIQLPSYPEDLGEPDTVFLQNWNGAVIILVWMAQEDPGKVLMTLSESQTEGAILEKYEPRHVTDAQVNGQPAVWVEGDYILITRSGDIAMSRLISQGHTLIWASGDLTFRLETDADLETAVKIAESLH